MRWVDGYSGLYSVTKDGRVWSNKRQIFLAFGSSSSGRYKSVCLFKDGKAKSFSVHRLVAKAYIPNPENKPQVNHIDGDKLNNQAENLEWCTGCENMKHAASSGLLKAQEHSRFKSGFDPRRKAPRLLSEADVKSIRNRNLTGETFRDISKDYPVDESSIRRCCKRQTYKDII